MKIVDLNNYDDNDGLKNKLRQRMDTHEPELSDSVWDRIHHEMDRKDANRKKRFLWWFSSVAVVLLTSGIFAFMAYNSNEQPQAIAENTSEIIITSPNNPNVTMGSVESSSANKDNLLNPNNRITESTAPTTTNTIVRNTTIPLTPPPPPTTNNADNGGITETPKKDEGTTTNKPNNSTPTDKNQEKLEEKNVDKTTNAPLEEQPVKEEEKKVAKDKTPKKDKANNNISFCGSNKRWFVGMNYSFNRTYRTVNDIERKFFYPNAEDRNKLERAGYTSSYGIDFGFYPIKNFFIKSGVGIFNTKEMVKYDVKRRTDFSGIVGPPDIIKDSIAYGTSNIKENTYSYLQIPLEIGYSRCLGNRWGVFVSGGLAYNILRNYDYYFIEPLYGSEVIEPNSADNYTDMYKNYFMLSGNIGAQYSLTNRWVATVGINYRRAITSAANEEYAVDVKPYSIGASTGLAYRF